MPRRFARVSRDCTRTARCPPSNHNFFFFHLSFSFPLR